LQQEQEERKRRDERIWEVEETLRQKERQFVESERQRQLEEEEILRRERQIMEQEEKAKRSTHSSRGRRDVGGTSERLLAEISGSKRSRLDSPRVSP
jgi:hypothetical protein